MSDPTFYAEVKDLCYIRRRRPELITRREYLNNEESLLVFDDRQKKFLKLTGSADDIWQMLDGKNSVEAIVTRLQEQSDESRELIVRDVCRFIAKAGKGGMIKAAVKKVDVTGEEE